MATTVNQTTTITPRDVRRAAWVCFFAWTFAVYDFVLFGNLLPVLASDLGWTSGQSTSINTWVTFGTACAAFTVGPLIDRVGRRRGIVIAVTGAAVASLATAVAGWLVGLVAGVGLVALVLVRSLAGLGYAEQAINATYLGELMSVTHTSGRAARRRGTVYALVQAGWPVGSVLAAASVYVLFPIGGWALCFVVAALPAVGVVWAAGALKESPRLATTAPPLTAAFRGESLRPTLVLGSAFLLNWFGVLVFSILGTSVLTAPDGKGIAFDNALVVLVVSNATAFAGYVFHGWLGDRIGRRRTIALGWVLAALSFSAMLLGPHGATGPTIALYSLGLFFLIGPFSALLFFNGESFPTASRASGVSIINAAGQIGAILAGAGVTLLLEHGHSWTQAAFWCGAVPVALSAVLVLGAREVSPSSARQD